MNICFVSGKIVTNVDFKFVFNNRKYLSIVKFEIEDYNFYSNKANINMIYGYNEIADKIYANYENGDYINIIGEIKNNGIKINEIYKA